MRGAQRIALTAILSLASSTLWAQSHVPWVSTWAEASALAQRHQRLVLIHFLSNNCPPCVKLERSVFNQPEVIRAMTAGYVPLRVNVDENDELARFYRVERWPTDVIVTAQGAEVYRGASPMDPNRYVATLDQVASHTRIGVPFAGSPSTDIAMTSPNDVPHQEALNRASSFPVDATAGPSGSYAPPTLPGGMPYGGANTAGVNRQVGGGLPEQGGAAAHAAAGNRPPAPSYMMNQYATEAAGQAAPQARPAEQRASYTSPYGGEFQPPSTSPSAPAPVDRNGAPQSVGNPYVAGLPTQGGLGLSPSGAGLPGSSGVAAAAPAPGQTAPLQPSPAPSQAPSGATTGPPTVAMEGYCSVTLLEQEKWVKGDSKWGAVHRGRVYLFAGPEQQQRFLADYDRYAPALSGYDCTKYAEQGALVDGKRAHGVFYRGQIFLFADEAALQTFWSSPEHYVPCVRAEQQRQAARPGGVQR